MNKIFKIINNKVKLRNKKLVQIKNKLIINKLNKYQKFKIIKQ